MVDEDDDGHKETMNDKQKQLCIMIESHALRRCIHAL